MDERDRKALNSLANIADKFQKLEEQLQAEKERSEKLVRELEGIQDKVDESGVSGVFRTYKYRELIEEIIRNHKSE